MNSEHQTVKWQSRDPGRQDDVLAMIRIARMRRRFYRLTDALSAISLFS
jgi:hypothetical protein